MSTLPKALQNLSLPVIGAPLFIRQPKGMEPTEIGTTVLRRARVILREMASIEADVRALRGGHAGSVRVGAVTGPAISYLVSAIRRIKEESPQADITVDVMPSRDLLMHLAAGEMDFVLGRILPEFDSDAFNILPMSDEKVALMARADPAATFAAIPPGAAALALWHEPDYAERTAALGAFAQLSGHSHGGQVRLPGVGPLFLPRGGERYVMGLNRAAGMPVYTTRGVGVYLPPIRVDCPPEVTLITLVAP